MKKSELTSLALEMLEKNGIPDAKESARVLLNFALGKTDSEVLSLSNIDDNVCKKYLKYIKDRCNHYPLDKIIGYKYFYDAKIPFNKNVLTPRLETEFLVDRVVIDIKNLFSCVRQNLPFRPISVLDLCTGSGCVGIAIANATGVNVTLSDVDTTVLDIAKHNNDLNNEDRKNKGLPPINLNYVLSDMFKNIKWKFDMIVCNPPYIKSQDLNKLEIEVKDFDPMLALDGGKDGLDFYRVISKEAYKYLNDGGTLYLEIGINQSLKIVKMLEKHFCDIKIIKDLAGIDRFIIAKKVNKNA